MKSDAFEDLFGTAEEAPAGGPATAVETESASPPADADKEPTAEPQPDSEPEATAGKKTPVKSDVTPTAIFFDIETGPVSDELLAELFEFDPTKVKGYELLDQPFDPATVKTGNLKDQAKIDAKIEAKRKEHEQAVADVTTHTEEARNTQWQAFVDDAPLSALTGQVLAIGYGTGDFPLNDGWPVLDHQAPHPLGEFSEKDLLERFWSQFLACLSNGTRMIGHNICGFDLPFLVQRSWLLGVDVPPEAIHDGRHWNRIFVDLMQLWGCGAHGRDKWVKLDRLAQYFGVTRKSGEGDQFAALFWGPPKDRQAAIDYLKTDLIVTCQVAAKMGVF